MIKGIDGADYPKSVFLSTLEEIAELVRCANPQDGTRCLSGAVWVSRSSTTSIPVYAVYDPVLCVVVQGTKQILLGGESYVYDTTRFLLNTVALPVSSQVIGASPDHPFLSVSVVLDPVHIRSVILEAGLREPEACPPLRAMEASRIDTALLGSVGRLARLASSPKDAHYLAPLALREVIYRLLTGEQGARMYQCAFPQGRTDQVIGAMEWMRKNFDKPLRIEALARECGMSPSGLHHHFKSVTAMSPLQFQKHLRLQEARRLMIAEGLDAAGAGFKVGYDDASYFSRDYKRFFGAPPSRDAARLRNQVT